MGTHQFFGQVPESDVASLVTDLAGKQPIDSDLTAIAALTPTNDDVVQRKAGAWTNRSMSQLKTDLALVKGDVGLGNVDNTSDASKPVSTATQTALDGKQPLDSDLTTIAGLTATTDNFIQSKSSAWASRTPTQVAADLVTPLSSSLQPLDSDLTAFAALTPTNDDVVQRKAGAWTNRTMSQLKTDLVLVKGDVGLGNVDNVQQQPLDSDLTTIAGLTATTDNFIQSKSSAWASRTPTQVAADLVTPLSSSLQPLDSDLTAIAALAPANDDVIQRKAGAWTNRTIAQLKTDLVSLTPTAHASTHRLGGSDPIPVLSTLTTVTSSGAHIAIDASTGSIFRITASTSATTTNLDVPTNGIDGMSINLEVIASGIQTVMTINASILLTTNITSTSTIPSGKKGFYGLRYSGSTWYLLAATVQS
jgi:hypothetical protein